MFHQVSDKKYAVLERRNLAIAATDYRGLDERIIPILELLQRVEGVQCIWSCSGHTPAEHQLKKERKVEQIRKRMEKDPVFASKVKPNQLNTNVDTPTKDEFYFIFAAGRKSESFMVFLSDLLNKNGFKSFKLNAITLNWCFDDEAKRKGFNSYPAWEFGFEYKVMNHGAYLEKINKLYHAIELFLMRTHI